MGKSSIVILNSNKCVSGNTQRAQYFVDWKAILDVNKKYYLHWTYLGGANVFTGTKLPCIYAEFLTTNFMNDPTGQSMLSGANNTQMLGFLKPIVLAGSTNTVYFQAEDNTNLPIYLPTPPTNNIFNVSILDNNSAPYLDTATTPVAPAAYVLLLRFTEIEE